MAPPVLLWPASQTTESSKHLECNKDTQVTSHKKEKNIVSCPGMIMHSLDVYFRDTEQRVSSVESQALA